MLQDRRRICEGIAAALEDVLRSLNNLQERMHRGELFYACVGTRLVVTSACSVPVALLLSALALQVRRCAVAMLLVAAVQSLLLVEPDAQYWPQTGHESLLRKSCCTAHVQESRTRDACVRECLRVFAACCV